MPHRWLERTLKRIIAEGLCGEDVEGETCYVSHLLSSPLVRDTHSQFHIQRPRSIARGRAVFTLRKCREIPKASSWEGRRATRERCLHSG